MAPPATSEPAIATGRNRQLDGRNTASKGADWIGSRSERRTGSGAGCVEMGWAPAPTVAAVAARDRASASSPALR